MPVEERISVRIPAHMKDFKKKLAECARKSGISESEIVLQSIMAVCDYVHKHGEISFPVAIRSRTTDQLLERLEAIWREILTERDKHRSR